MEGLACAQAVLLPQPRSWQHEGQHGAHGKWSDLDRVGGGGPGWGGGLGLGRPEQAGTCQEGVPQRWKFRVTSLDSQSVSRITRPGPRLLSLRGLNPGQGLESPPHQLCL